MITLIEISIFVIETGNSSCRGDKMRCLQQSPWYLLNPYYRLCNIVVCEFRLKFHLYIYIYIVGCEREMHVNISLRFLEQKFCQNNKFYIREVIKYFVIVLQHSNWIHKRVLNEKKVLLAIKTLHSFYSIYIHTTPVFTSTFASYFT